MGSACRTAPALLSNSRRSALTAAETKAFGVYVHWPFCLSKCPYCDFNSHVRHAAIDEDRFARAFAREIETTAARVEPARASRLSAARDRREYAGACFDACRAVYDDAYFVGVNSAPLLPRHVVGRSERPCLQGLC